MRILLLIFSLIFANQIFALNQSIKNVVNSSKGLSIWDLSHNTKILNVCTTDAPCEDYVFSRYNGTIFYYKKDNIPGCNDKDDDFKSVCPTKDILIKHHNLKMTALGNAGTHIYAALDSGEIYTLDLSHVKFDDEALWHKMPDTIKGTISAITTARSTNDPIFLGTLSGDIYQNNGEKWVLLKNLDVGITTLQYDAVNKYLYVGTLQGFTYYHALDDDTDAFHYIYGTTPNLDITSLIVIPSHNSVYAVNTNNEVFKKDIVTSESRGNDWQRLFAFQSEGKRSFFNATINARPTEDKLLIGFDNGNVAWHDLSNSDERDWNFMMYQSSYPVDGPITSLAGNTDETLRLAMGDINILNIDKYQIAPSKYVYDLKFYSDMSSIITFHH